MQFLSRLHKVLGSALSLILLIWVISGFVLIFHKFPHAKKKAYFENSKTLDTISFIPKGKFKSLSLELANKRQYFRVTPSEGKNYTVNDTNGKHKKYFSYSECKNIATNECIGDIYKTDTLTKFDRWIPWSHFKRYFPIYKFHFDDEKSSVLYVSSVTGTIVQHTTSSERVYAWFGAIPHWFYFKWLRLQKGLWINVILSVSGIATIFCLLGLILGIKRTIKYRKRKDKKRLSLSPFKKRWYKWHHISGLIFGIVLLIWCMSGFFSLTDAPEFIAKSSELPSFRKAWYGKNLVADSTQITAINSLLKSERDVKKIEWKIINNQSILYIYRIYNKPESYIFKNNTLIPKKFFNIEIREALKEVYSDSKVKLNIMTKYDSYYYSSKKRLKPLPVFKSVIDDELNIYLNPENGKIVKINDPNSRAGRWLYKGMHCFNIGILQNSIWRIVLIIILLTGCTIMCVSGLWLFLRRLL